MRLFIAINLPGEMREAIAESTSPLREALPELRWVRADKLHLTVRFLGDQPGEMVPRLNEALRAAALRSAPMTLTLAAAGAFPTLKRARVVWLGVEYEPKLELLYHDVETACMSLGFEVEGRLFRPHITLARVPVRLEEARARDLARAARGIRFRGTTLVESVDLMNSDPGSGGSRYTVLSRAALRSD